MPATKNVKSSEASPPSGYDQKRVWDACDALNAEGIKPTYDAVRRKLGGGSFSTIASGVKTWEPKGDQPASPVPAATSDRVAGFAVSIWQDATLAARAAFEVERSGLTSKISQLEMGVADYEGDQRRLISELEALKTELDEFRGRNRELELQNREMAGEIRALERLKGRRATPSKRTTKLKPAPEITTNGDETQEFGA